jgi:L-2-hydroxyglutarate oxidase LhgO
MDSFDICIAGAGVVGLALAHRLAERMPAASIVILEQESSFGQHTSSRLSEVIHAGIYYPRGSLKARLCVAGKRALYRFCETYQVPYRNIGKLIISQNKADPGLEQLMVNGLSNGVEDLLLWDQKQLLQAEPNLQAAAALYSPSTGIVDSHHFMATLLRLAETAGVTYAARTEVITIHPVDSGFDIETKFLNSGKSYSYILNAKCFVNCAGLQAQALARRIESLEKANIPSLHFCKGDYFDYSGRNPFQHLIYPLPEPGLAGLGIHSTQDLAGQLRFGPDTEYVGEIDYKINPAKQAGFAEAIKRYFPALDPARLSPAYAGIRPKLTGPDESPADFCIQGPETSGLSGLLQLFGIESPGLTASLAIGDYVTDLISEVTI